MTSGSEIFTILQDNVFFIAMWGVLLVFVAAIIVGALVVIKNHNRKSNFEGNLEFDLEKIAGEIDVEITNLRSLRNRILPYANLEQVDPEQEAIVNADGKSTSALSAADPSVVKEFQNKITELESKLKEAQSKAGSNSSTASEEEGAASASQLSEKDAAELEKQRQEFQVKLNKQEEELKELKKNKDLLEKIVSEYQLFEDDFALVKKYKRENEELRKRLMDKEGLNEEQVDSLLATEQEPSAAVASAPPPPRQEEPEAYAEAVANQATNLEAPSSSDLLEEDAEAAAEAEAEADDLQASTPEEEKAKEAATNAINEINAEGVDDAQAAIDDVFDQAVSAAAAGDATEETNSKPTEDNSQAEIENVFEEAQAAVEASETKSPEAEAGEDDLMAEFEKLLSEKV
ncbi:hypothetical protein GW915_13380 [bacterium]|nr:hypothetical protein [bacterium]